MYRKHTSINILSDSKKKVVDDDVLVGGCWVGTVVGVIEQGIMALSCEKQVLHAVS